MIVYGRNPVREALRGPRTVRSIWATRKAAEEPWLGELGIRTKLAAGEEIERRCGSPDHQGICAEVSDFVYADTDALLTLERGLVVALDQIQDPQNLGAVCRTAESAGAAGVVIPERRAAEVTAAVAKASAGAIEHLPIARVRNLTDFLTDAKRVGRWCYGADADVGVAFDTVEYAEAGVLVLGAEGRGLRPRVAGACDVLVTIPLRGKIESLNVSAAAAVLIYAMAPVPGPLTER
jgi:23S rRNA (guanosine2251-2'-O)-methyltransferase